MICKRSIWAMLGILLLTLSLSAAAIAQSGAAHPEMIVSAQWLADHLKDPDVVVLHVAEERSEYDAGHIPGARLLLLEDFIEGRDVELPTPEKLKDTFEKLGVSNNSHVVVYTTTWYPSAGRAYYTLDYLGHGEHTSLLDGGLDAWKAQKHQVDRDVPKIARASFTPHLHPEVRAMLEDVKKLSGQPSATEVLVDSRPEKRYTKGHIAGATFLYWQDTMAPDSAGHMDEMSGGQVFLPPAKLKELFVSRGLTPEKKLVTYCEVGMQASHMYFIAKYLGYDAAMYDGSIHQWSHMNNLPLVEGKELR